MQRLIAGFAVREVAKSASAALGMADCDAPRNSTTSVISVRRCWGSIGVVTNRAVIGVHTASGMAIAAYVERLNPRSQERRHPTGLHKGYDPTGLHKGWAE